MYLQIKNLSKRLSGKQILENLNLEIREGELFAFLGPSGSGKTTLLNCILGILQPDEGQILLEGTDITHKPSNERNIGMVFQNYSLFPNMNVYQNIEFPLLASQNKSILDLFYSKMTIKKNNRNSKVVEEALETVKMTKHSKKFPDQLSGGEQQRVALARALVFNPKLLCLDEPLSAIDKNLRFQLQNDIRALQKKLSKTMLYVTHDQSEAFLLSDRIAILKDGKILQIGTPEELYYRPQNEFIALFLGECNIFHIKEIKTEGDRKSIITSTGIEFFSDTSIPSNKNLLAIRPESFSFLDSNSSINCVNGIVSNKIFVNGSYKYDIYLISNEKIIVISNSSEKVQPLIGEQINIAYNPNTFIII